MKYTPRFDRKRLNKILDVLSKVKIMVVGDLILDEYIWGNVERISPEAPVPVVWAQSRSYMPGGAANVASNILSLQGKASLVGVVGEDVGGALLLEQLKKRNIAIEGIHSTSARPTTLKTRIVAQHQQLVRVDWEEKKALIKNLCDKLIRFIRKNLRDFDALIIEDYGKGMINSYLLSSLLEERKKTRIITTVDPKEDNFELYRGTTAITPNRKEAENAIRNIRLQDTHNRLQLHSDKLVNGKELNKAGRCLLEYLDLEGLLITLGEEGMQLFPRGKQAIHIDTVAQQVFDVTGAGDTVIAVFTMGLAAGASMEEAAYVANVAAGIVVGKLGLATVSPEELRQRMKELL